MTDGTIVTLARTGSNIIYYVGLGILLVVAGLIAYYVISKKKQFAKSSK